MAEYENPVVPEGINVSPVHPLKDFLVLVLGVTGVIMVVTLALALLAGYLVRFVPFAQEQALVSGVTSRWFKASQDPLHQRRQVWLQGLAERLVPAMDLPPDMNITVHYVSSDTVNAMATLGGHVVVFQGLLEVMPNENALAMVMAHEIAHIRHRHPIVAMGRGFTVALALSTLAGVGDGLMQQWAGSMGMVPVLSFSRAQETEADATALEALQQIYGHVEAAGALFEHAAAETPLLSLPTLLSTHPEHEERIRRIQDFARAHPPRQPPRLVPLPDFLKKDQAKAAR